MSIPFPPRTAEAVRIPRRRPLRTGPAAWLALLWLLLPASGPVAAHGDHDHGGPEAAAPGEASPRFEAHSELFEVVGVLRGGALTLTVDRWDSNEPVLDAEVELESGSWRAQGEARAAEGDYRFAAQAFEAPGAYPVTLTITTPDDVDLLAATLVVPGHDHEDEAAARAPAGWRPWAAAAAWLALGLLAGLALGRRRPGTARAAKEVR